MTSSVRPRSCSSSVSPRARITFSLWRNAACTFRLSCSSVSLKSWRRSECPISRWWHHPASILGEISPVNGPWSSQEAFCAPTSIGQLRSALAISHNITAGGRMTRSTCVANTARSWRRRSAYSSPSGTVKCIFQLPAISGLRMGFLTQRRDAWENLAFEELQGCPAPGRYEGHAAGQVLFLQGGHQVAAANDRFRVTAGQPLGQRIGSPVEGRDLVDAERSVPDDGVRAVTGLQKTLDGHRPHVEDLHVGRNRVDGNGLDLHAWFCVGRDHRIERQYERAALAGGGKQRTGDVELVFFDQRAAHLEPLGLEEGARHRAADAQAIDALEETAHDADLAGDLGAADDGNQRMGRVDHDSAERLDLALHQ